MRIRVQVFIESDQEAAPLRIEEVACFERDQLSPETLGLRLKEAKQMLLGKAIIVASRMSDYPLGELIALSSFIPQSDMDKASKALPEVSDRDFIQDIGKVGLLPYTEIVPKPERQLIDITNIHDKKFDNQSSLSSLDQQLLVEAEQALAGTHSVIIQHIIHNNDHSIGTSLAQEIVRRYGNTGLPGVSITCTFQGAAGENFGALAILGLRLILTGEAKDYVGKDMIGGQIIISPPAETNFASHESTIIGNMVLYNATGGQLFVAGCAGEHFAEYNSGAVAVVEGVGDYACEKMTGGMVVVIGKVGQNFGVGMSSGVVYILDEHDQFSTDSNTGLIALKGIDDSNELAALHTIITWHAEKTRSKRAAQILDDWQKLYMTFWRVQSTGHDITASNFVSRD